MINLTASELIVVAVILLFVILAIAAMLASRRAKGFKVEDVTLKTPFVEAKLKPVEEEKPAGKQKPKRAAPPKPGVNRSVNVKGSANGAVIVTGDNNKVNKSG